MPCLLRRPIIPLIAAVFLLWRQLLPQNDHQLSAEPLQRHSQTLLRALKVPLHHRHAQIAVQSARCLFLCRYDTRVYYPILWISKMNLSSLRKLYQYLIPIQKVIVLSTSCPHQIHSFGNLLSLLYTHLALLFHLNPIILIQPQLYQMRCHRGHSQTVSLDSLLLRMHSGLGLSKRKVQRRDYWNW